MATENELEILRGIHRTLVWILIVLSAHAGVGVLVDVPVAGALPPLPGLEAWWP